MPYHGEHRIIQQRGSVTKVNTDISKSSMNQPALTKKKKKKIHMQPQWIFFLILETLSEIQTCEKFSTLLQEWAACAKNLK